MTPHRHRMAMDWLQHRRHSLFPDRAPTNRPTRRRKSIVDEIREMERLQRRKKSKRYRVPVVEGATRMLMVVQTRN
jgi:hypothetical protein